MSNGDTVYPGDPAARNFSNGTAGWTSSQNHRLLCVAPGITCIKWQFSNSNTDGPAAGDGSLHIDGNSLGLAPCIPEFAEGQWVSPLFQYTNANASSWTINYDMRKNFELLGEGHDSFSVQILDENGNLVTTADAPQMELPWNKWQNHSVSFDGSKLVPGKNYRIAFKVEVMQAEAAGGWGSFDISNIGMTVGNTPGAAPLVVCKTGSANGAGGITDGLSGLLSGKIPDVCPLTSTVGQAASPLLSIGNQLIKSSPIADLIQKGSGVLAVADPITGDMFGWMVPSETAPTLDPRDLPVYLMNGTEGSMANYVVLFALRTPSALLEQGLSGPGGPVGNVLGLLNGQVNNALGIVSNPFQLVTNADPTATLTSVMTSVQTVLGPLLSNEPAPDTAIGGTVWSDTNKNGIMDSGEPVVPNVKVTLTDDFGKTVGTQTTGTDGKYRFSNLDPTSDPNTYYLTFDPTTLPSGATFTTEHAPGSTHVNDSTPDPTTGKTQRIALARGTQDLTWNAGITGGTPGGPGGQNGTVGISFGTPTVNDQPAGTAPGPQFNVDQSLNIKITVTNTGTEAFTGLGGDTPLGTLTCTPGTVQPGQQATCTITIKALPGAHKLTFNFSVHGVDGQQVSSAMCVYYTGQAQSTGTGKVTIGNEVLLNGQPIVNGQPIDLTAGSTAKLTVNVSNTGTAALTHLSATATSGTPTCTANSLDAGAQATCTLTFPVASGASHLTLTIVGQDAAGNTITATYTVTYASAATNAATAPAASNANTGSTSIPASSTTSSGTAGSGGVLAPVTGLLSGLG